MKLAQMRNLVAVAERGSLRAAARHLGMAQPALTRSIRELERELGTALFERQARGMVLTPMGQLFVRRAGAVVNEVRRAREEIEQSQGGASGSVVACLSSVPHIALLPDALAPFRARYPNVRLRIIEGVYPTVETALKDGSADFYVGPSPDGPLAPELTSEKLFDNTRVVLGRKGHPLANAGTLKKLASAEWMTSSITYKAEEELGELFARYRLPPPKLMLQGQSALTVMAVLTCTDLLCMVPVQWIESDLFRGSLQRIEVRERLAAAPIVIIRRRALPLTPAAEYLCDLLRRASTPYARAPRVSRNEVQRVRQRT